jgi:hypothetical protein
MTDFDGKVSANADVCTVKCCRLITPKTICLWGTGFILIAV